MKKPKTRMTIICAYHKKNFGAEKVLGHKDGRGVSGITGGICKQCLAIERSKLPKDRWKLIKRLADLFQKRRDRGLIEPAWGQEDEDEEAKAVIADDVVLHTRIILNGAPMVHYIPLDLVGIGELYEQLSDQPEIKARWN